MLFDSSALSQFPGFQVVAEFQYNLPIDEIMAMITSNEKPKNGSESMRIDLPFGISSSNTTPAKDQPVQAPAKNATINQSFQQTEAEKKDFLKSIGLVESGDSLR